MLHKYLMSTDTYLVKLKYPRIQRILVGIAPIEKRHPSLSIVKGLEGSRVRFERH